MDRLSTAMATAPIMACGDPLASSRVTLRPGGSPGPLQEGATKPARPTRASQESEGLLALEALRGAENLQVVVPEPRGE